VIEFALNQALKLRRRSGVDGYGQPTFAAATALQGRWLRKQHLVRNAQGEQQTSDVSVTLGPSVAITVGDQLSADDGASWLSVIAMSDSRGLSESILQRVYLVSQGS